MLTANALSASARSELLGVNVLLSCTPTVRHRVWVFNPTPRSLELGLQAGCGCAVAEEIPQVLIPIAQPKFTKMSMPDNPLVYYYQRKRLAGFPAKHNGRRSVRPPGTPSPSGANARRPHEP
jgi:hypothetical protein